MSRDFRTLDVWKKAHLMALEIIQSAKKLPAEEDEEGGLAADVCRSALAIPAIIVRGCAFDDEDGFRESLCESLESSREVEIYLLLMRDLGYIPASEHERLDAMNGEVRTLINKQMSRGRIRSS